MENLYKKCDNCGEKHWDTEPCAQEYIVYPKGFEFDGCPIREWSFARAAEKFVKQEVIVKENGDTTVVVEKDNETREYDVTMTITVEYETERTDES